MRQLLREPLVRFIVAAGLVLAVLGLFGDRQTSDDLTIEVTLADMQRLASLYASEAGVAPSPDEVRAIVIDHVRQIALAREARHLGLDQGDIVVERRLAQKMSFMVSDLVEIEAPREAELREWYDSHKEKFQRPAAFTFEHVFFADRDDARIEDALLSLNSGAADDWRRMGDPFILQRQYGDLPPREIVRLFGSGFADAITNIDANAVWTGPIASAYGAHMVRLIARRDAALPEFDAIRSAVEADWRSATTRLQNEQAIGEIIAKYKVEIEGVSP